MLSFYEFDCVLRKLNRQRRLHEADEADLRAMMDRIRKEYEARKGGTAKTATAAPAAQEPAIKPAPAAPTRTAQTEPVAPETPATPAVVKSTTPDVNDPSRAAIDPDTGKSTGVGRASIMGNPSKLMQSVATTDKKQARLARFADLLGQHNDIMQNWPTLRYFTVLAMKDLGIPAQIGDVEGEPTKFALAMQPGQSGRQDVPEIVVKDPKVMARLLRKVRGFTSNPRAKDPQYMGYLGQILKPALNNDAFRPIAMRAADFMKAMYDHDVVGKPMTLAKLAHVLGQKVTPEGTTVSPDMNLKAVSHLVKSAEQKGNKFPFFKISQGTSLDDPRTVVEVIPLTELGRGHDPLLNPTPAAGGGAMPQPGERKSKLRAALQSKRVAPSLDDLIAQQKAQRSGQQPNECHQWMDICELMEHWGF